MTNQFTTRHLRKLRNLLHCLFASFSILACAFVLMPFSAGAESTVFTIAAGLTFWLGLLASVLLLFRFSASIKDALKPARGKNGLGSFSILVFFRNPYAKAADILFLTSLGLFVLFAILDMKNSILFIVLAAVVFSFCSHGLLNSNAYAVYFNRNRAYNRDRRNSNVHVRRDDEK